MDAVLSILSQYRLIPILVMHRVEDVYPVGEALLEGGLPVAEITFRSEVAAAAIAEWVQHFPDMLVGAGTVLTVQQAEAAHRAGAQFIVSPGFSAAVAEYCRRAAVRYFPGVATATEIQMALEKNLDIVKFFPSEASGGIKTIRALSNPFPQVRFIPTGGITADNVADYLALSQVLACGGSWMVRESLIQEGRFDLIRERVQQAVEAAKAVDQ